MKVTASFPGVEKREKAKRRVIFRFCALPVRSHFFFPHRFLSFFFFSSPSSMVCLCFRSLLSHRSKQHDRGFSPRAVKERERESEQELETSPRSFERRIASSSISSSQPLPLPVFQKKKTQKTSTQKHNRTTPSSRPSASSAWRISQQEEETADAEEASPEEEA